MNVVGAGHTFTTNHLEVLAPPDPSAHNLPPTLGVSPCTDGTNKRKSDALDTHEPAPSLTPIARAFNPPKRLRIEIPTTPLILAYAAESPSSASSTISGISFLSDPNSLFDAGEGDEGCVGSCQENRNHAKGVVEHAPPAHRSAPPVPGLFFDPTVLIPPELETKVFDFCIKTYFQPSSANQVMLFNRFDPSASTNSINGSLQSPSQPPPSPASTQHDSTTTQPTNATGFPQPILELISTLSSILKQTLPSSTYDLLFPEHLTMARQAIINLYRPGEGITPHVDLLGRYGDGIMGVSFNSSCVMRFDKVEHGETQPTAYTPVVDTDGVCPGKAEGEVRLVDGRHETNPSDQSRWDLFLPERSVVVLSGDARYKWTHGIDKRSSDSVYCTDSSSDNVDVVERGTRLSVTLRWLLPGADVVGD